MSQSLAMSRFRMNVSRSSRAKSIELASRGFTLLVSFVFALQTGYSQCCCVQSVDYGPPDMCEGLTCDPSSCIDLWVPDGPSAPVLPEYLPVEGLVGWWPFNGNANDESGNANHGFVFGPQLSLDRLGDVGTSYEFDGEDDFISFGDLSYVEAGEFGEYSISLWVNPLRFNSSLDGDQFFLLGDEINQNNGVIYQVHSSHGFGSYTSGSVDYHGYCSCFPSLNDWINYTVVQGDSGQVLYINGISWGLLTTIPNNEVPDTFRLGSFVGCDGPCRRPFHGRLDDIGIWNRALTAEEVMALYLGNQPVLGCTDSAACNFNTSANSDDGSCVFPTCNISGAINYEPEGSCPSESACVFLPGPFPTDGLIAFYPFDGNAIGALPGNPVGEVIGADFGENRFGQSGKSARFQGGDWIRVNDNAGMRPESFAISVWTLMENQGGPILVLAKNAGNGGYESIDIVGWHSNGIMCNIGGPNFWGLWLGDGVDGTFPRGVWNHVVYQFSDAANTVEVFVNGQRVLSGYEYASIQYDSGPWSFGAEFENAVPSWWLHGMVDDFALWNRTLSDCEILQIYTGDLCVPGCTDPAACNFSAEANSDDGSCIEAGCTDPAACNFVPEAGCDDGSCAPAEAVPGCMEAAACNYDAAAVCAGLCVYPPAGSADCGAGSAFCGEGMVWDAAQQQCLIDPAYVAGIAAGAAQGACGPWTVWDAGAGQCVGAATPACASDLSGNGSIGIEDLLILLSEFAMMCP
jgi:hypothetical protein